MEKSQEKIKCIATPRRVDIEITSKCNLRCKYCYYFNDSNHSSKDLPTDDWLRFFEELRSLQVMDISLAGGEPFLREDLRELLRGIADNQMRFSLLSNGTAISDEICEYLISLKRCDSIQISLDGGTPEVHDIFRGKGTFQKAVGGIKLLQRYGLPIDLRLTVHHMNVGCLEQAAEFILENLELPFFSTNSAGYLGSCKIHSSDILLTTEDRILAMKTLEDLSQKYPGRINATAGPLSDARLWRRMIEARKTQKPAYAGHLSACGCMFSKLSVLSDGTIVPCNLLPHFHLGKINQDSLQDIWLNSKKLNALRARNKIPLSDFEMCKSCDYQGYCTGNCPSLAYSLTGNVNYPSPDACLKQFLDSGGYLP